MESRRPGGYDVNDTAAETAALHSGKLPTRAVRGNVHGNNLSVSTTWVSSLCGGRDGARPSHSSLVTAAFGCFQNPLVRTEWVNDADAPPKNFLHFGIDLGSVFRYTKSVF
ncbi:MAG: hypothetical protein IKR48_00045 [Kiritimatiellae bacterium]|nr:hypothetical protein [Kiritimatiellia bacterium]